MVGQMDGCMDEGLMVWLILYKCALSWFADYIIVLPHRERLMEWINQYLIDWMNGRIEYIHQSVFAELRSVLPHEGSKGSTPTVGRWGVRDDLHTDTQRPCHVNTHTHIHTHTHMQVTEGMDAQYRMLYGTRQSNRKRLPRPFTGGLCACPWYK